MGEDDQCCYLISEDKITGERIGTCSFMADKNNVYDLAYCVDKKHWGKGYATETAKALINYAKAHSGEKATIWVNKRNAASNKVAQKCGGVPVKESSYIKRGTDQRYEDVMYEIVL